MNRVKHVLKTSAYYCLKLYNDILEESSKQWKGKKFEQIGETQNADLRPSQMPSWMQQPSLKQMCLSLFQDCKLHLLHKQKNQRCIWIKKWTKEHGIVHGQSFNQHWTCPYIFLEAFLSSKNTMKRTSSKWWSLIINPLPMSGVLNSLWRAWIWPAAKSMAWI